jgi:hypothetical protein
LLVRILSTTSAETRDAVIRATNTQIVVSPASLRATDEIQRQIERYFKTHDWYYDRRKNYYRNVGEKADRIVSIEFLAQAVMAGGLGLPHEARSRATTLLKSDRDYKRIFRADVPLATYLWLAKVLRRVVSGLLTLPAGMTPSERTNLRFHVTALVVARRFGHRVRDPMQLTALAATNPDITTSEIRTACEKVVEYSRDIVRSNRWTRDRAAKNSELTDAIFVGEFGGRGQ